MRPSLLRSAVDLLIPPRCAFCGAIMEHPGNGVCPRCHDALPLRPEGLRFLEVGQLSVSVPLYYAGACREGIRAMKFHRKACRAQVFGKVIAWAAAEYMEKPYDTVTYVPVSFRRKLSRGFDQAQLLALSAGEALSLPAEATLKKVRHNAAQSSLTSAAERLRNVEGVYVPLPGAAIAGKHFLLIDDVCTTGSTLLSAARVLLAAGAASVSGAVLAGGRPPKAQP